MSNPIVARSGETTVTARPGRALPDVPADGPRLLFFSGGTALNDMSRRLKRYTWNSVHLITPFDSGGSSQVLRRAFDMPAVGDLRSRLMALADETVEGQFHVYRLFTHRFAKVDLPSGRPAPAGEYAALLEGTHPLLQDVPDPARQVIDMLLVEFDAHLPKEFDFRGASVGNLILAGVYFAHGRQLAPALELMTKMAGVQGIVRGIVDVNLEIGAELDDGTTVIGQRDITGKEVAPLARPIRRLFLVGPDGELPPQSVPLGEQNRDLITGADLICFPPGSLYTSVIANLLPAGVGRAVAASTAPKVHVPNLGTDPECQGQDLVARVEAILSALRADAGEVEAVDLIGFVLADVDTYDRDAAGELKRRHGIETVVMPLVRPQRPDRYDPDLLARALVQMA
ncbi:GAK system CofD-like protein [Chachezhania sediminis]|uniref:GAK system CofD-like protein n=1 Tax=Chachezhania sediminis TaxID=2599291 RepID=UPI001E307815|nr:GAK system CofD-like protein [Chachezhania sediminis]